MQEVRVLIKRDGLEEIYNLDPETDPDFEDTLGEVLCAVFQCPAVKFHIEVLDLSEEGEN